ncbi:MAG: aminopeptidase [Flavobacterium sp.]
MKKLNYILFLFTLICSAQHHNKLIVEVDSEKKILTVIEELTYYNQSDDTLTHIVLNDWVNAYTSKNTPMAKRFSDEFERSFHLAQEKERGRTSNLTIIDQNDTFLTWERNNEHPDVIQIRLREKLYPGEKFCYRLTYFVKIPSDRFTNYGYGTSGKMNLKDFFLVPARYENKGFLKYDNLNLDDCPNALSDYEVEIKIPQDLFLFSDLNEVKKETFSGLNHYHLQGKNRLHFSLFISDNKDFILFKNTDIEVVSNLAENRITDIQKALLADKIVNFVTENLGQYPHEKIPVTQADYDRNPFYGLNQLPMFISPFPDEFMYEIKFLKTYINNYLHNSLRLDPRKDNWIFDGIQIYLMMKYMDEFHPNVKMMGNVAKLKLLNGYNLVSLNFNGQYSYFYMLMARKNLDQPLSESKENLIRFNEKIASKYRAGLSLKYLDSYLENGIVQNSIREFYELNKTSQTGQKDFESILTTNSPKKINWFFDIIIDSRDIIDYTFDEVTRTKDTVNFSITNKTETVVPVAVYGVKNKNIVYKKWFDTIVKDSIYSIPRNNADKIVLNYENEVPEYNQRNNWKSLKGFRLNNRPIKFNFMKDLEDPNYNQILYVPTIDYNYYDGLLPGIRFHNKTILDKPFNYDINPTISTKTLSLSGRGQLLYNQYNRDSNLYNIRYIFSGHHLHYAPDAYYTKLAPTVTLNFRPDDFRDNRKASLIIKEIIVNKEKSTYAPEEEIQNYEVFNVKFIDSKTEVARHFSYLGDFQYSGTFGKISGETQYRNLFDNNRLLSLRLFAGTFLHNDNTSNYFDFGLDRPTDYLFESEYLGRSETTGLFSQQSIVADGFFKSKLDTRFANQWMVTTNMSYAIWNWIEAYGDLGLIKNRHTNPLFVYDSGIRLNLVTNYFELFFPVYSNLGWEISDKNYYEKIRFIVSLRTNTLATLFTRKWF